VQFRFGLNWTSRFGQKQLNFLIRHSWSHTQAHAMATPEPRTKKSRPSLEQSEEDQLQAAIAASVAEENSQWESLTDAIKENDKDNGPAVQQAKFVNSFRALIDSGYDLFNPIATREEPSGQCGLVCWVVFAAMMYRNTYTEDWFIAEPIMNTLKKLRDLVVDHLRACAAKIIREDVRCIVLIVLSSVQHAIFVGLPPTATFADLVAKTEQMSFES
jgi:hypothetical protein